MRMTNLRVRHRLLDHRDVGFAHVPTLLKKLLGIQHLLVTFVFDRFHVQNMGSPVTSLVASRRALVSPGSRTVETHPISRRHIYGIRTGKGVLIFFG